MKSIQERLQEGDIGQFTDNDEGELVWYIKRRDVLQAIADTREEILKDFKSQFEYDSRI